MVFYAQKRSVTPRGSTHGAFVAFVGDVPTRQDLEHGEAFYHDSGSFKLIARGLRHNGIDPNSCFFTHAVLHGGVAYDKVALRAAAKARKEALHEELTACGAKWIVPMGPHALKSILGLKSQPDFLKGWRGSVSLMPSGSLPSDTPRYVTPVLHPSFLFSTPKWKPWFQNDINRLGRLHGVGSWSPPEASCTITIGRTVSIIKDWLARHDDAEAVASDVETVGLGPTRTGLVCYGLGVRDAALIIPWSKASNGAEPWFDNVQSNRVVAYVNTFFESRYAVSHNGPAFDHIVLARYGFRTPLWHDTLLMSHAGQSHMPKNLAHLATTWLDVGPWKTQDHASNIEDLWFYNAQDVIYTIRAFHAMVEVQGWPKPQSIATGATS